VVGACSYLVPCRHGNVFPSVGKAAYPATAACTSDGGSDSAAAAPAAAATQPQDTTPVSPKPVYAGTSVTVTQYFNEGVVDRVRIVR